MIKAQLYDLEVGLSVATALMSLILVLSNFKADRFTFFAIRLSCLAIRVGIMRSWSIGLERLGGSQRAFWVFAAHRFRRVRKPLEPINFIFFCHFRTASPAVPLLFERPYVLHRQCRYSEQFPHCMALVLL